MSSRYTLSIGCINDEGLSTYFSEICPSTMACIFTGGSNKPPGDIAYDKPDISIVRQRSRHPALLWLVVVPCS